MAVLLIRALCFVMAVVMTPSLAAQDPTPPVPVPATLEQILQALQHNIDSYIASLPNLFCAEHISSDFAPKDSSFTPRHSLLEATFRIRRPPVVHALTDLQESRDIKLIDGQPLVDEMGFPRDTELPSLVLGVFANAPAVFAPNITPCFDFLLLNPNPQRPGISTLLFTSRKGKALPPECSQDRPSHGMAQLDQNLHLIHLEKTTTHYLVYPQIHGTWDWSVDYKTVDLAGRLFYLPSHIYSKAVADHSHNTWTFDATYNDYHRLFAKSRLLPPAGE